MSSSTDDDGSPTKQGLHVSKAAAAVSTPVEAGLSNVKSLVEQKTGKLPSLWNERWNTKFIGKRVAGDVMAASAAGALVAPLITVIDR